MLIAIVLAVYLDNERIEVQRQAALALIESLEAPAFGGDEDMEDDDIPFAKAYEDTDTDDEIILE